MTHRSLRRPPLPRMTFPCSGRRTKASWRNLYRSSSRSEVTAFVNTGVSPNRMGHYTPLAYPRQGRSRRCAAAQTLRRRTAPAGLRCERAPGAYSTTIWGFTRRASGQPRNPNTEKYFASKPVPPIWLDDFIGQERIVNNLRIFLAAARKRGEAMPHVLVMGKSGYGKSTLAFALANEIRSTSKLITP